MVEIREVHSLIERIQFADWPNRLYQDVPQYVPPPLWDEISDWEPKSNPAFSYCEAQRWLALRDGKIVGRAGAILSRRANEKWRTNCARFTQADFIDDPEVSGALFRAVEDWARAKGCDAVHGPLGFTDLDREGMLIDGFDRKGMLITYYNHPYYPEHLARLGYEKDVDWVEYLIDVPRPEDPVTEQLNRLSECVQRLQRLHVAQIRRRADFQPYIERVFALINTCYAGLYGTVDLDAAQVRRYADKFLPLLNPHLACFVMNEREETVAFAVSAPSIADALKRHNGRLFPLGFADVLRALRESDTLDLFLIAVRPDYQNKGVNAILMNHVLKGCHELGIVRAETGPQLETNARALNQWNLFSYQNHKRRRCFVKKL